MNTIIIANAIALIASIIMVLNGLIKDNKKVLASQCVQFTLSGIANFMLGGITGTISNALSFVRNVYSIRKPMSMSIKVILTIVQVGLSLYAGLNGWIDWLPIISNSIFTFTCDTDNRTFFKVSVMFTGALWLFYDLHYLNFSSATFDVLALISNTFTLIRLKHQSHLHQELS